MLNVLVISSMVARGHVGLSAAVPVLNGLGAEAIAVPTILLSNHPGHARFAGMNMPVSDLADFIDALDANAWLSDVDAILTGYFPTADHVSFAVAAIARVRARRPDVCVCCDPVLGDHPGGLYVSEAVASAVRSELLSVSDMTTPNAFELSWLTGLPVNSVDEAIGAARALPVATVLATSVPAGATQLANVATASNGAWCSRSPLQRGVPHGTGDAMAAAFLAAFLQGAPPDAALARATGCIDALVAGSLGHTELQLVQSFEKWTRAAPGSVTSIP